MNKKVYYEAPEAEILVVKFEENIMSNPTDNSSFGDNKGYMIDKSSENWGY